jgi:hypothetical protein
VTSCLELGATTKFFGRAWPVVAPRRRPRVAQTPGHSYAELLRVEVSPNLKSSTRTSNFSACPHGYTELCLSSLFPFSQMLRRTLFLSGLIAASGTNISGIPGAWQDPGIVPFYNSSATRASASEIATCSEWPEGQSIPWGTVVSDWIKGEGAPRTALRR